MGALAARWSARTAALESALAPAAETLFLRACLPTGEAGREAFECWQRLAGEPVSALRRRSSWSRRLLGTLFLSQAHNGAGAEPRLLSVLRAAYAHEQLRATPMRLAAAELVKALEDAGVGALLVGGAALAEWYYLDWGARHCHDVDLLIGPGSRAAAERVAGSWRQGASGSGVEVALHTQPYAAPWYRSDREPGHRLIEAPLQGVSARALDPGGTLIHICGRSLCSPARDGRWAIDAWFVLHRHPELDWEAILRWAVEAGGALGLLVRLRWLARELDAPIPGRFLSALADAAGAEGLRPYRLLLPLARRQIGARELLRRAWLGAPGLPSPLRRPG